MAYAVTDEKTVQTGRSNVGNSGLSGKQRVLQFMLENANASGYIHSSTREIAKAVSLSEHEVVHFIKEGLARNNLISFRESARGLKRLKLSPIAMGKQYSSRIDQGAWFKTRFPDKTMEEVIKEQKAALDEFLPEPHFGIDNYKYGKQIAGRVARGGPIERIAPKKKPAQIDESKFMAPVHDRSFPLIEALSNRRTMLEQAAKLAEQVGAEDLAISILERAETPLNEFELEAVRLWQAYSECLNK